MRARALRARIVARARLAAATAVGRSRLLIDAGAVTLREADDAAPQYGAIRSRSAPLALASDALRSTALEEPSRPLCAPPRYTAFPASFCRFTLGTGGASTGDTSGRICGETLTSWRVPVRATVETSLGSPCGAPPRRPRTAGRLEVSPWLRATRLRDMCRGAGMQTPAATTAPRVQAFAASTAQLRRTLLPVRRGRPPLARVGGRVRPGSSAGSCRVFACTSGRALFWTLVSGRELASANHFGSSEVPQTSSVTP